MHKMKYFNRNLFLLSIFFFFFVFTLFSSSENIFDIGSLPISEKRLALNLIQIYNETINEQNKFYVNFENTQKMFSEIKKDNNNNNKNNKNNKNKNKKSDNIDKNKNRNYNNDNKDKLSPPLSFVQLKSKGPVEEETIWRAMYDTQLRRSPATEEVHVFSLENVEKEYGEAKLDAFKSQINIMKDQFEKNLHYMKEELSRQKKIKNILNQTKLLEEQINKVQKNKPYKNGPIKKSYATKTQC